LTAANDFGILASSVPRLDEIADLLVYDEFTIAISVGHPSGKTVASYMTTWVYTKVLRVLLLWVQFGRKPASMRAYLGHHVVYLLEENPPI